MLRNGFPCPGGDSTSRRTKAVQRPAEGTRIMSERQTRGRPQAALRATADELERNKAIVRRFVEEIINGGDLGAGSGRAFPHEYLEGNYPLDGHSGPEVVRTWVPYLRWVYPDVRHEILDLVAEGDTVMCRSIQTGTPRGFFEGKSKDVPAEQPGAAADGNQHAAPEGRQDLRALGAVLPAARRSRRAARGSVPEWPGPTRHGRLAQAGTARGAAAESARRDGKQDTDNRNRRRIRHEHARRTSSTTWSARSPPTPIAPRG